MWVDCIYYKVLVQKLFSYLHTGRIERRRTTTTTIKYALLFLCSELIQLIAAQVKSFLVQEEENCGLVYS